MEAAGEDFLLLDVREPQEYEAGNLSGLNIPLGSLEERMAELPKNRTIIIHCRSGKRSAIATKLLTEKYHLKEVYNLKGGIKAYQAADTP